MSDIIERLDQAIAEVAELNMNCETDLWGAREEIEQLRAACQKMLECTGGSQYWNGCTHDALVLIEAALGIPSLDQE